MFGVVAVAMVLTIAFTATAQTYDPEKDLPKPTLVEKALTKLGRGIQNFFLGWAEIPVTLDRGVKEGRPLGYLLGVAPVLGTARAAIRTGAGVYEAATFGVSDKKTQYRAIVEPEYIF
jgi:putative exosortase-associated protein (TIGR04073 family)